MILSPTSILPAVPPLALFVSVTLEIFGWTTSDKLVAAVPPDRIGERDRHRVAAARGRRPRDHTGTGRDRESRRQTRRAPAVRRGTTRSRHGLAVRRAGDAVGERRRGDRRPVDHDDRKTLRSARAGRIHNRHDNRSGTGGAVRRTGDRTRARVDRQTGGKSGRREAQRRRAAAHCHAALYAALFSPCGSEGVEIVGRGTDNQRIGRRVRIVAEGVLELHGDRRRPGRRRGSGDHTRVRIDRQARGQAGRRPDVVAVAARGIHRRGEELVDRPGAERCGSIDRQPRHRRTADGYSAAVRHRDRLHHQRRNEGILRVARDLQLRLRCVDGSVEDDRAAVGENDRLGVGGRLPQRHPLVRTRCHRSKRHRRSPADRELAAHEVDQHAIGGSADDCTVTEVDASLHDIDAAGQRAGVATPHVETTRIETWLRGLRSLRSRATGSGRQSGCRRCHQRCVRIGESRRVRRHRRAYESAQRLTRASRENRGPARVAICHCFQS